MNSFAFLASLRAREGGCISLPSRTTGTKAPTPRGGCMHPSARAHFLLSVACRATYFRGIALASPPPLFTPTSNAASTAPIKHAAPLFTHVYGTYVYGTPTHKFSLAGLAQPSAYPSAWAYAPSCPPVCQNMTAPFKSTLPCSTSLKKL